MLSNDNIKVQLISELEKAISEFHLSSNTEKLMPGLNELMDYDFKTYKSNLKEEIEENLKSIWTNPENGINKEQKLDAILFEHYIPDTKDLEAFSYGIIDWEEKEINGVSVDMGWDFDFTDGLEQDKGVTLLYFNPYVANTDAQALDDYELAECYKLKGLISIHEAFVAKHHPDDSFLQTDR